jgi:predicted RNA-binding protein YlxR (DUF448 family)
VAKPAKPAAENSPERTCIVTRTKALPGDMIRFVAGPGAIVVPDIRRKLPGRGVWVLGCADLVERAVRGQAFSRGLKMQVTASPDLPLAIEKELTRDCLQALSLANKAGLVVTGFAKVEEAIVSGSVAGLVHAAGCSADGVRKLDQVLYRRFGDERARPSISMFGSSELDLALGRTNVIHAALAEGAASEGFLARCQRLTRFRSASPQPVGFAAAAGPRRNGESNGQWRHSTGKSKRRERKTDDGNKEPR